MLLSSLLKKIEYSEQLPEREITHITNNSRAANERSVFVCVKGFLTDGHLFANGAYMNGCRAFVAERPLDLPEDASIILVKDSRATLALLACEIYNNPSKELITIGITGTKGKTTSALMLKQLLDRCGIPTGYIGSNGIIYGASRHDSINTTPESHVLQEHLRRMVESGARAVVMEVSSQALSLSRISGIEFDVSIFTNFSPDHIGPGEHETLEDYFNAKKLLFDKYTKGTVIANADDAYTEKILKDCKMEKIFYSTERSSDCRADKTELIKTSLVLGTRFDCTYGDKTFRCELSVPGEFNIHNALAAIAAAFRIGLDEDSISRALSSMNIEGRFETVSAPNGACFVIDYAHNGLSLESALKALRGYEPKRLICLFGSVGCRTQIRRAQMGRVAADFADFSILTSDNPDTEPPERIIDEIALQYSDPESFISIPDRREAIEYAYKIAEKGDIILLAGKGHEAYQLINGKKLPFSEREIIQNCINSIKLV